MSLPPLHHNKSHNRKCFLKCHDIFPFLVPYYSITSSFRLHVISGVCKSRMGAIRQLCCGTSSQFGIQDTLSTFQISLKTSTYDKSYSQAWIQSLRNIAAAEGFSTMHGRLKRSALSYRPEVAAGVTAFNDSTKGPLKYLFRFRTELQLTNDEASVFADQYDVHLEKISQNNGSGVDNHAYEIEEDDINHYSSIKNETKKPKKRLELGSYLSKVSGPINATENYIKAHSKLFKYIVLGVLGAGYVAYFIAACVLDFKRATALVVLTCLAVAAVSLELLNKYKGKSISRFFKPAVRWFKSNLKWIKWVFILVVVVLLVVWLALDTSKRPTQLISFGGVCVFIVLLFLFSAHRTMVSWRPVFWGLGIQFCLGLFIIRTEPGFIAFDWLGKQVQIFLDYTKEGSSFVFGDLIGNIFAFQALPIVIFFSSVMSVLYYLGIMQWLILKISWVMQITMGTSSTETLSVAGNIFVGQTEAPLLIRPYLKDMTKSEIHAVMTGGFATIAGSVMGAFISFGIDASSLISASVMAAPCALAISKLSYPETEESRFKSKQNIKVASGDEQNILEAVSSGASASIGLVANIAANLIAFLAILGFINSALKWLGGMVGYPDVTFQLICSYVFMPVAFMMGVTYDESFVVAKLIGTKLFLNEFVAYEELSKLKQNRLDGLAEVIGDERQWISVRSEIITTYALCGFANFSSLGIVIGGLSSICPLRRNDISSLVFRAMITGTCVSLINACIAGILFVPPLDCVEVFNGSPFNATLSDVAECCQELFQSTINNGTVSFEGFWGNVANATIFLSKCCQCCGFPDVDVCI
ncbi:sodium/nucleoside cotransporter 1 isoform X1 [Haplochromis burtoni]|uniref:sodium/nucleoside cotransporter 1 isoform X1 n=1 Tax=Haplochromis burtoni TaxID=8153 RepID=UPI001C2DC3A7|nr:sodium/nucleoside cotransporter 1 isoform X1 [Haplochromis burtoni]